MIAAEESQEGVASAVPIVAYRAAHPESVAAAADTIVDLLVKTPLYTQKRFHDR